jgi:hypothetical protein
VKSENPDRNGVGGGGGGGGGYDVRIMIPVSVLFTNKSCSLPYLES